MASTFEPTQQNPTITGNPKLMNVSIATLIPVRDQITSFTIDALNRDGLSPCTVTGKPVDEARNELVRRVLAIDPAPDVVLWIDADAWWPSGTVDKLLNLLHQPRVDVATGFFGVREAFRPPTILKTLGDPKSFARPGGEDCPVGQGLRVGYSGLHFVAHRRSLLERLGPDPFSVTGSGDGEDAAFCRRILAVGGTIVCHTGAPVAHVGDDGFAYLPGAPRFVIRDNGLHQVPTEVPKASFVRDRSYGTAVDERMDAFHKERRAAIV
jgi:Glycosyltransferase like family 2